MHIGMWYYDPTLADPVNTLKLREEEIIPTIKAYLDACGGDCDKAKAMLDAHLREELRKV